NTSAARASKRRWRSDCTCVSMCPASTRICHLTRPELPRFREEPPFVPLSRRRGGKVPPAVAKRRREVGGSRSQQEDLAREVVHGFGTAPYPTARPWGPLPPGQRPGGQRPGGQRPGGQRRPFGSEEGFVRGCRRCRESRPRPGSPPRWVKPATGR